MKGFVIGVIWTLAVVMWWFILATDRLTWPVQHVYAQQEQPAYVLPVIDTAVTPTAMLAGVLIIPDTQVPNVEVKPQLEIIQAVVVYDVATPTTEEIVMYSPPPEIPTIQSLTFDPSGPFANVVGYGTPFNPSGDIDDDWDSVATPGNDNPVTQGWPYCTFPLSAPFVDWSMASEASLLDGTNSEMIELPASVISSIMSRGGGYFPTEGTVTYPESMIKPKLIEIFLHGTLTLCQNDNHQPNMSGPGVQEFLDFLATGYLH